MVFRAVQKLSMVDYPGFLCATVFTPGCNFRCPFCHNGSLVLDSSEENLEEYEVLDFLSTRTKKLDAICLTGGEPLLQKGVAEFLLKVREMGFKVKLDTNGTKPRVLKELSEKNLLDYIAMDIKNSPDKYAETVGVKALNLNPLYESIEIIKNSGIDYEFRTTVSKTFHTAESLKKAGEMIKGAKVWYLQPFRNSEGVIDQTVEAYDENELKEILENLRGITEKIILR